MDKTRDTVTESKSITPDKLGFRKYDKGLNPNFLYKFYGFTNFTNLLGQKIQCCFDNRWLTGERLSKKLINILS